MSLDPYKILDVDKDATQEAVKKAFRQQARKYHPDVNPGNKEAEEKFKQLSEAFDILSDEKKRQEYDRLGEDKFYEQASGQAGRQQPNAGGYADVNDLFGDLFGRGGGFEFEHIFNGGQGHTSPAHGEDLLYRLEIGFHEAVFGTETTLEFDRETVCPACSGRRVDLDSGRACSVCRGAGYSSTRETLKTRIPAGIDQGQKVRLAGKGRPGQNGGSPGDLFLEVTVRPDAVFTREGRDVYTDVNITLFEAVLGAKIEIGTLTGRAGLKIPAGIQNGAKLRLKGQGVPKTKTKPAGDLYVRVKIKIPQNLSDKARKQFVRLQKEVPMSTGRK